MIPLTATHKVRAQHMSKLVQKPATEGLQPYKQGDF